MRARVQGLDKLERKLKAMPREVQSAISVALEQNAEELTAMQRRLVPVDDGVLRGSIGWEFGSGESRIGLKGQYGLAVTITAGGGDAYYAPWVEFGTSDGKPAASFFFPSYRALRKRMKSRITRAQNKAIKEIAAR